MISFSQLTPSQLRHAASIQEQILSLQEELSAILGAEEPDVPEETKTGRRLSARGLANIRSAAKRRWAAVHAAQEGNGGKPKRKGAMSDAGRARIAAALKARWAAAKRAGRNAL